MTDAPDTPGIKGPATWLVTRRPKPERVAEFERVLSDTIHAALRFPGHMGVTVLKPSPSDAGDYRLVVRFDSDSSLRRWQQSEEAREWFQRISALEARPGTFDNATGLETWFTLPTSEAGGSPSPLPGRRAMFLVTWLAAWPTLALLMWTVGSVAGAWPVPARAFALSGLMVALLTYVVMPRLVRWLSPWLFPRPES